VITESYSCELVNLLRNQHQFKFLGGS